MPDRISEPDDKLLLQESDVPESPPAVLLVDPILNRPSDLAHVASPSPTQTTREPAHGGGRAIPGGEASAHGNLLRLTNVVP